MYIESILALQAKAGGNAQLPLAIMTSGDTHAKTEKLLQDNAYFGMQPGQITLLKQEKVILSIICLPSQSYTVPEEQSPKVVLIKKFLRVDLWVTGGLSERC